jgi:hypothetical protein
MHQHDALDPVARTRIPSSQQAFQVLPRHSRQRIAIASAYALVTTHNCFLLNIFLLMGLNEPDPFVTVAVFVVPNESAAGFTGGARSRSWRRTAQKSSAGLNIRCWIQVPASFNELPVNGPPLVQALLPSTAPERESSEKFQLIQLILLAAIMSIHF